MARKGNALDLFLQPVEYFVGNSSYHVRPLLGSCVSITLWRPERCIGTMSHFLLARREGNRIAGICHDSSGMLAYSYSPYSLGPLAPFPADSVLHVSGRVASTKFDSNWYMFVRRRDDVSQWKCHGAHRT